MSDPKLEEIAEAVAGKRCEYRGPGIVGPCAEFHEVCAATQRTNTLAILAALREATDEARHEEREAREELRGSTPAPLHEETKV